MTNKIDINFLKKVPVVAYALIILFLMGIIVLVVMRLFFSNEALLFYLSYYCNTYFLTTIFALIFFYIFIKMFLLIYDSFVIKKTTIKEKNAYLKDLFYFLIIIYIGAVSSGIILNQLPHNVTPEKIIWTSNLLMNYDHSIFGKDLLFFINGFVNKTGGKILGWTLLQFYNSLPFVFITLASFLFLYNKILAKKFILFFFAFIFLSFPMWYVLPGLNPMNFYVNNVLRVDTPNRISSELKNYEPNSVLSSYQKKFSNYSSPHNFLDVTTFPSAHAGFSVEIIIYAFLFYPPSIFITLPWFILEMTGALYLGQHYAIDLFLGSIMAILVYYLIELLFNYKTILRRKVK